MKKFYNLLNFLRKNRKEQIGADLEDFSHAVGDVNSPIKMGLMVICLGFGGFLIWAALAPLDEGVPTQGTVSLDTKRKPIQHLTGGIIKKINVKEGQIVKEGEILVSFDDAPVKARYEEVKQKYVGDRALENRLEAELSGDKFINFSPDIKAMMNDDIVKRQTQNQEMLLNSRRASLNAEILAMKESLKGLEDQEFGYSGILNNKNTQLLLLRQELDSLKGLVDEGFVPKSQQRDTELKIAQTLAEISDANANWLKTKRSILEVRQKIIQREQENRKELETQLSVVRQEVDAYSQKYNALLDEYNRIELKSPVSGQVVGLQFQSVGAVVQSGQKLMDIVPTDERLLLEARVAPSLIDRIHKGQKADVRFSSFSNSPQLVVDGLVESISKDLITDSQNPTSAALGNSSNNPQNNSSYYLARISLTESAVKKLGSRQLQPGMPVLIVIKTGERSLLKYLLHPFSKRMAASLKEE